MLNRYLLIFLFRVSEEGSLLFGRDETTDPGAGPENTPRGFAFHLEQMSTMEEFLKNEEMLHDDGKRARLVCNLNESM